MSNEQCECGTLDFPTGKEYDNNGSFIRINTSSTFFDVDLRHPASAYISTEQQFDTISKILPDISIIPTSYTIFLGSQQTIVGSLRIVLLTKDGTVLAQKYINDIDDTITLSEIHIENCNIVENKNLNSQEILLKIYSICNRKTQTCCEQPPLAISLDNQINSLCIDIGTSISENLFRNPAFIIDPPPPQGFFETNFSRLMPEWSISGDVDLGYITLFTINTGHTWLAEQPEGTASYIDNNDLSWDLEGAVNNTNIGSISQTLTLEANTTYIIYLDLAANLSVAPTSSKLCNVEIRDNSNNLVKEYMLNYQDYNRVTRQRLLFNTFSDTNFVIKFTSTNLGSGYGAVITRPQLIKAENESNYQKRVFITSEIYNGSTFSVNAMSYNNNALNYKWQQRSFPTWSTINFVTTNILPEELINPFGGEYRVLVYDNYGHGTISNTFYVVNKGINNL